MKVTGVALALGCGAILFLCAPQSFSADEAAPASAPLDPVEALAPSARQPRAGDTLPLHALFPPCREAALGTYVDSAARPQLLRGRRF